MDLMELLKTRRSFRRFDQSRPVPDSVIQKIARAQQYASCSGNSQSLRYMMVSDPALVEEIFALTRWAAKLPPEDGQISQKTEDLVGPYELHDFFLYYMLRFGYTPKKIQFLAELAFDGEYDTETIKKWLKTFYRRFFSQQFKRSCLPDGPKVGTVAVSPRGDLRMPSDASVKEWLDEIK